MKSILILGGGVMQLPAIQTAIDSGWRVIVADGNSQVPGAGLAHHFERIDLKDKDAMLKKAREYRDGTGLDGVFTAGTDFSDTVAWVAENLSLPGIPYEAAVRASNKSRMREAFVEAGVPAPAFLGLEKTGDPLEALERLKFPLVVKPVDNMGSRGIRRVDDRSSLIEAFKLAGDFSRSGQVILEEYISGPEFSLDALVEEGKITLCGFADRHIYFEPYFIEMGHTLPTRQPREVADKVFDVFCRGIRALGITHGAAKGDIKLGPNGPVIGEIAARLSGGFMSGWTFPFSSGVDVTRGAMNLALGLPAGDLTPLRRDISAERAFISLPGRILKLTGYEESRNLSGIEFSYIKVKAGDRVTFPRNNVEKCGNFISRASGHEEAAGQAEEACRGVHIHLAPSDPETGDFLLGRTFTWVPRAYTLTNESNRTFAASLPLVSPWQVKAAKEKEFSPVLLLARLPEQEAETGTDWHGLSFSEALNRVLKATGARWAGGSDYELGGLFWKAFLRGGVQGGIWIIQTLMEKRGLGPGPEKEFLAQWR